MILKNPSKFIFKKDIISSMYGPDDMIVYILKSGRIIDMNLKIMKTSIEDEGLFYHKY